MRRLILLLILMYASTGWSMDLELDRSSEGDNAVLVANGTIGLRDARELSKILDARAEKGHRTIILMTSPGGILESVRGVGEAIIKASNKLYEKYEVSNIFAVNTECTSACSVLTTYLTSKRNGKALEIFVDSNSIFGIHGPNGGSEAQDKQITAYLAWGAKADWIDKHDSKLRQNKITEFKAKALCTERTMIIPPGSCWNSAKGDLVEHLKKKMGVVYDEP